MNTKKVLFIISAGHSGSSLLSVILGSHPQCFSAGEFGNLPNRYRNGAFLDCINRNSDFWEETFGKEGIKQLSIGLGDTRATPYIPLKIEKRVREFLGNDQVFNPYSLMFSKLNEEVIIDATKFYPFVEKKLKAREFRSGEVEAYLLHLVRDGRAVLNSFLRRFQDMDVVDFTEGWVQKTKGRQAYFHSFKEDKKIEIAYEDLASQPHQTIQTICQWIGIEFIEDMLEYWKYDHHDISGNDGTYSLIRRYQGKEILDKVREVHGEYYEKRDLSIKLDLRWKKELSPENLEIFNRIAGAVNQPYEYN
ncbi:sulfotransferase [Roseofilum sp. BLCC_M154]|uniref:Sulfotransferase n=1 Tax=Roseofilum acuticapitatum BLCC-M154 TaxID=3022444 RepID=A0ABT7AR96_9CYAN|nr:sulfotransferase [Roseofilum acuticapitatum]MDJ1169422.1 sulfotransferase [Roseofilum acuticapitatum BLCC-M154]